MRPDAGFLGRLIEAFLSTFKDPEDFKNSKAELAVKILSTNLHTADPMRVSELNSAVGGKS